MPLPVVSPASGRVLPETPILFVQAATYDDIEISVTFNGEPVAHEMTVASEYDNGVTYRVAVDARGEGVLEITAEQYWEPQVWRYRVDPEADPPTNENVRLRAWSHLDVWSCSRDDAIIVDPGMDADALYVEWAYPGHQGSALLPSPNGAVALGKVSCAWQTVPADALESMTVRFTALYSDGSERQLGGSPVRLERRWLPDYPGPEQQLSPMALPASDRRDDEPPGWPVVAAIAALLVGLRFSLQRAVLPMRSSQP